MKLSELFDGEVHYLEVGELFDEARDIIADWEEVEVDEDDVLDPWETPDLVPVLKRTGDPDRPGSLRTRTQQGWGTLAVCMTALAHAIPFKREMWEKNHWSRDGESLNSVTHEFRFIPLGDNAWQGGRL